MTTYTFHGGLFADLAVGVTAEPADGTRGQAQTVTADIYATEHIGTSDVRELDPWLADNTAEATVAPAEATSVDPIFRLQRSVAENLPTGTLVSAPISAFDQNSDGLTYSLSGDHSVRFRGTDKARFRCPSVAFWITKPNLPTR